MGQTAADTFPKGALIGAGLMIALSITAAATARWTGIGAFHGERVMAVETVELTFADRTDGGIVAAGPFGETVFQTGNDGFVRGVLRGLARERKLRGIGAEAPFRLVRRVDGRLVLEDPATGHALDLGAYGSANADTFGRLLGVN